MGFRSWGGLRRLTGERRGFDGRTQPLSDSEIRSYLIDCIHDSDYFDDEAANQLISQIDEALQSIADEHRAEFYAWVARENSRLSDTASALGCSVELVKTLESMQQKITALQDRVLELERFK